MSLTTLILRLLALVVVGFFAVGLTLFFLQRRMIFPAPAVEAPEKLPAGVQRLELGHSYALFLPAEPSADVGHPAPTMIFTHGNGEAAFMWQDEFNLLRQRGIHILLVEYPGYGGAAGSPSSRSIERAQLAAYDALLTMEKVDPERIFAYGRSVGGGAACLLADKRRLAALCLESSFSSLHDLVRELGYPAWLLRDRFDNAQVVARAAAPVWIAHGRGDSIIPFAHAERLQGVRPDSQLIPLECGHNDCPRPWSELLRFLEQIQLLPPNNP